MLSACSLARYPPPPPQTSLYQTLDVHLARGEVGCQDLSLPHLQAAHIQNKFLPSFFPNSHLFSYWLLLWWVSLSLFSTIVGKASQELCFQFVQPPRDSLGWNSSPCSAPGLTHLFPELAAMKDLLITNWPACLSWRPPAQHWASLNFSWPFET